MANLRPIILGFNCKKLTLLPDYNIFHFPIISLWCLKTLLFQLDLMLCAFQLYILFLGKYLIQNQLLIKGNLNPKETPTENQFSVAM